MPRKGTVKVVVVNYRKSGVPDRSACTLPFYHPSEVEQYYVRPSDVAKFINSRTDAIDRLIARWVYPMSYVDEKLVTKAGERE